jgi:hypothetical protein
MRLTVRSAWAEPLSPESQPLQLYHGRSVVALLVALCPSRKASAKLAREGRVDYLLVESTGISEPLPAAEPRLGRRTVLTFPLLPPPQKN